MVEWFASGGFGMFMVLALGIAGIGYGVRTLGDPTPPRMAVLRGMPALVMTVAVFAFGVNLWAVNRALESDSFLERHHMTRAELPTIGLVGVTEAAQVLTLGAALTALVLGLGIAARAKSARGHA